MEIAANLWILLLYSLSSSSLANARAISGNRLSEADLAEWTGYNVVEPEGPGTYSFGYDVEDPETGNVQFRSEDRHRNGTVTGSYGFMSPDGYIHIVHYIADHLGYRAKIEDGGRLKPAHLRNHPNSDRQYQSPQMTAALQSIRNFKRTNKLLDQRTRPYDQQEHIPVKEYGQEQLEPVRRYGQNQVPVRGYGQEKLEPVRDYMYKVEPTKKYEQDSNEYYNYYYVPSNQINRF